MTGWESIEAEGAGSGLRCLPLLDSGIGHVFTLRTPRRGGAEAAARRRILAAAGFRGGEVLLPRQVHGAVLALPDGEGGLTPGEADAVAVARPGLAAAVGTADCVGAILAHPETPAFAVIHAGWRGVLAGVVESALEGLRRLTGSGPEEMTLAIGPSARRCCYQVDGDVAGPFRERFGEERGGAIFGARGGKITLDTAAAVREVAVEAGLRRGAIHDAGICTMCSSHRCWSHRIQGGEAGRMWTAAWIPPISP